MITARGGSDFTVTVAPEPSDWLTGPVSRHLTLCRNYPIWLAEKFGEVVVRYRPAKSRSALRFYTEVMQFSFLNYF